MATQSLPDGHALGLAIKQRFEQLETKLAQLEKDMGAGFTQVLENEKGLTDAIAELGHQSKPFKEAS